MLEHASATYRWLLKLNVRTVQVRYGLALALLHTGRVEVELGRPSRAEPSLREGLFQIRKLVREDPLVTEHKVTGLLAAGYLGEALYRGGRTSAAAELLREVAEKGDAVLSGPDKGRRRFAEHAHLLHVLASLERDTGNLPQSLELCRKAREKLGQARKEVPGDWSLQFDWLATREELARQRFLIKELPWDGWIDEQQRILAECRNLAGEDPSSCPPRFQAKVAESAAILAGLWLEAGHDVEALACVDEVLPSHEQYVRTHQDRKKERAAANGPPAARMPAQIATSKFERATDLASSWGPGRPLEPEDLALRRYSASLLARRGAALAGVGRGAEAVDPVSQAIKLTEGLLRGDHELRCPPASPASAWSFLAEELYRQEPCYLYDLACQLALASTLPGDDGIPNPAARAVAALRNYIASGFDNPHKLHTDKALDPLRKRDDFQTLVSDLEAKVQGRR